MKRRTKNKLKWLIKKNFSLVFGLAIIAAIYIAQNIPKEPTTVTPEKASSPNTIVGTAIVTDGDTIRIGKTRIRFHGIDAPESGQTCLDANNRSWNCGKASTSYLTDLIGGRAVSCVQKDVDTYGRVVAVCFADGEDINAKMVSNGLALAYRAYSLDYVINEDDARSRSKGMWVGEFTKPWDYRRQE